MTSLAGLTLMCSCCDQLLLSATIIISVKNEPPVNLEKDIIFNEVDLICSSCKSYLNIVEDDLARDIKTYWTTQDKE